MRQPAEMGRGGGGDPEEGDIDREEEARQRAEMARGGEVLMFGVPTSLCHLLRVPRWTKHHNLRTAHMGDDKRRAKPRNATKTIAQ